MRHKLRLAVIAMAVIIAIGAGWLIHTQRGDYEAAVAQARQLVRSNQFARAIEVSFRAGDLEPSRPEAWVIGAGAAVRSNNLPAAVECYDRLSMIPEWGRRGRMRSAQLLYDSGNLSEAESRLRFLNTDSSIDEEGRRLFSTLLLTEGRNWEALPVLLDLIRSGRFHADELIMLGSRRELLEDEELLTKARTAAPEDPGPLIGLGRLAEFNGATEEALARFHEAVELDADQIEPWAGIGRIHLGLRDWAALEQWSHALPEAAEGHPDVPWCRGELAAAQGHVAEAVSELSLALAINPNHRRACHQLGQLLRATGYVNEAESYLTRAEQLEQLEQVLHLYLFGEHSAARALEASGLTEDLGRPWEAWAWRSLSASASQVSPQEFERLEALALATKTQTQLNVLPVVPSGPFPDRIGPSHAATGDGSEFGPIAFRDDAAAVGLTFTPYAGYDGPPRGLWIYQNFGGGAGVIDFDKDQCPDLYLVQGNEDPRKAPQPNHTNSLFRNINGAHYEEVSTTSRAADAGFGQGIAVGDVNGDGFPDIYVANIGPNRLFQNNGDGTFTDVSSALPPDDAWSTSCLLADLNGDGCDDVYDVNYLSGTEPFTRICGDPPEMIRSCKPDLFPAAADRLLLNVGDGRFDDVTVAAAGGLKGGKGLGVIAADLDGSGSIDIFVANDTTANFLLLNLSEGNEVRFQESAVRLGCAFNSEGVREACMGIALFEADGDGLADLFVTNFFDETNTLYQWRNGYFTDETARSGLAAPSVPMVGFGTQAVDVQLDGIPDLFVANGHIDDFRHDGAPWKMRPQLFVNNGAGRFTTSDDAGPYFATQVLGRAVARLDWNGDLRDDLVVTHLDRGPALLTNATDRCGNSFSLRLIGARSGRTAAGAVVHVVVGDRTQVHYLPAGGGYYAANEDSIRIGLGGELMAEQVEVHWPSGLLQQLGPVSAGERLLIMEGRDLRFTVLP